MTSFMSHEHYKIVAIYIINKNLVILVSSDSHNNRINAYIGVPRLVIQIIIYGQRW